MSNFIVIDGFTWEQVPVHMIEHLDCEVFVLHHDGSESLVEEGEELSEFATYVIEPSSIAVARAWLVANGYDALTLAGELLMLVPNYDEETLTIGLSDLTIDNIADRFRREAFA